MKKYSGRKVFVAVFISGRGSNLKSLINFSKKKISPIKIDIVFSNNKNAVGLKFAKEKKIKIVHIKEKNFYNLEQKLVKILNKRKIELICLAGFMKILSANFIKRFKGKILNIHPSLLPKYKGLNTHKRVLQNNEKYSGCTVHLVNSKLDSGKIILQSKIKILKNETTKSLSKKILKIEHKLFPKAILKLFNL